MTLVHGVVGLQHAAMAVYDAWCDRVPVIMGGNDLDAANRAPGVPTFHSAQDINAIVRDYTKWDDTPVSPQHFAQSFVRMYKIATTPPYGPVMMSLDGGLQTEPIREDGEKLYIPKFFASAPPQGEFRRGEGSRAASCQRRAAGHRGRPHGAHARRASSAWSSSPSCCRRRWSIRATG